jgi:hypothetical protein
MRTLLTLTYIADTRGTQHCCYSCTYVHVSPVVETVYLYTSHTNPVLVDSLLLLVAHALDSARRCCRYLLLQLATHQTMAVAALSTHTYS